MAKNTLQDPPPYAFSMTPDFDSSFELSVEASGLESAYLEAGRMILMKVYFTAGKSKKFLRQCDHSCVSNYYSHAIPIASPYLFFEGPGIWGMILGPDPGMCRPGLIQEHERSGKEWFHDGPR